MYEFDYENKLRYQTEPKCIYVHVQVKGCGVCPEDISLANEITRLLMPTSQSLLTCNLLKGEKQSNTKIPNIVLIIGL